MTRIFSNLDKPSRDFYQFLGIHSFLIGLFPFFLPVYLWKLSFSLSGIAFFIAISGFSFCIALWNWDRLHKKISLQAIILISFVIEILLLTSIYIVEDSLFLPVLAVLNGLYNCFFWITQRALFFETIDVKNSGKKFGNFQIFVVIALKAGVLIGGIFLELSGYTSVYILSMIITILGFASFYLHKTKAKLPDELTQEAPLSFSEILHFKDEYRSRPTFVLDGLYLYMESYFWVISLFLIAHESFWKLGLLVILLGGAFSLVFFLIKNSIDHLPKERIFIIATLLYALSWALRGWVNDTMQLGLLFVLLVSITFNTSFFRLAYNKRFFDLAKTTSKHQYLFIKSYYSQFTIAIFFLFCGIILLAGNNSLQTLSQLYWLLALPALLYMIYRPHDHRASS